MIQFFSCSHWLVNQRTQILPLIRSPWWSVSMWGRNETHSWYTRLDSSDPRDTLHYTTLHYTTLHYTTLHYTSLHYTTLHYITLHYTILHYILHYTTLYYTTIHYTLHYTHYRHRNIHPFQGQMAAYLVNIVLQKMTVKITLYTHKQQITWYLKRSSRRAH